MVIVGADPGRIVYSGDTPRSYLTEGIGEDFWPSTYDVQACDLVVRVGDRDSMLTARWATAREGILMGESCGTALWAALQVARGIDDRHALFVVLLPDSGRNYIGKLYNDEWLRAQGLLAPDEAVAAYDWGATACVDRRSGAASRPGLKIARLGTTSALDYRRVSLLVTVRRPDPGDLGRWPAVPARRLPSSR